MLPRVGRRIKFGDDPKLFTIQARDERYLICTRPYKNTVEYTIVDLFNKIRGPDNAVFCSGYETRWQCQQRLKDLHDPNHYENWGPLEISQRYRVPLQIEQIRRPKKRRARRIAPGPKA